MRVALAVALALCSCGGLGAPEARGEDVRTGAGKAKASPIHHLFIIVKENHTYDNLFATFPGGDGATVATRGSGKQIALQDPVLLGGPLRDLRAGRWPAGRPGRILLAARAGGRALRSLLHLGDGAELPQPPHVGRRARRAGHRQPQPLDRQGAGPGRAGQAHRPRRALRRQRDPGDAAQRARGRGAPLALLLRGGVEPGRRRRRLPRGSGHRRRRHRRAQERAQLRPQLRREDPRARQELRRHPRQGQRWR